MTDGQPTDDITSATRQTAELVEQRRLSLFPIAIGDGANLAQLGQFSPRRPPLKLIGLNFREFFEWLTQSVKSVSQSTPGTQVQAPDTSGWATL